MHVCDPHFGTETKEDGTVVEVDIRPILVDLIEKAPKLPSTDAQIYLRDKYETFFGIYNHDRGGEHPFALVMMNWNEDTVTGGSLHERMRQYVDNDVGDIFRISFTDFLDQPTYVVLMMIEEAKRAKEKKLPELEKALKLMQGDHKS